MIWRRTFWTALAERSGDSAFYEATAEKVGRSKSGVAFRLPPQSKFPHFEKTA